MCRSTAAPLMAMAGMAGTAVGVAIAVLREKADRRSLAREIEEEEASAEKAVENSSSGSGENGAVPDETGQPSDENRTKDG